MLLQVSWTVKRSSSFSLFPHSTHLLLPKAITPQLFMTMGHALGYSLSYAVIYIPVVIL